MKTYDAADVVYDDSGTTYDGDTAGDIALTAAAITAGAPLLGAPAVAQNHGLFATGIAAGSPQLGLPALIEVPIGTLMAVGITAGVPTLGITALTQTHAFVAIDIVTAPPILGPFISYASITFSSGVSKHIRMSSLIPGAITHE